MSSKIIEISDVSIANHLPLVLIAGPCQIESLDHALFIADSLAKIADRLRIKFIYKSSFDKANRMSAHGKRGVGIDNGLEVLAQVKAQIGCLTLTDIHSEIQCLPVSKVVDILQIPAFLCRQTDLLYSAAQTGKVLNIKKGQFIAPLNMYSVYEKLKFFNPAVRVMFTERGTCFGYHDLVSDMRSLVIMKDIGIPIVYDATHSVQRPGMNVNGASAGDARFIEPLSTAAVAVGVAALFLEVHQSPQDAPSDGDCMLNINQLERILLKLIQIDDIVKSA